MAYLIKKLEKEFLYKENFWVLEILSSSNKNGSFPVTLGVCAHKTDFFAHIPKMSLLDEAINSLLKELFDFIAINLCENTIVYTSSLKNLDNIYIQNWIQKNFKEVEYCFKNNELYSIDIKYKKFYLSLRDSFKVIPVKLERVNKKLLIFPHRFINENRLYFFGNKPRLKHYSDVPKSIYKLVPNFFCLKLEALKFIKLKTRVHVQFLKKTSNHFYNNFNINLIDKKIKSFPSLCFKIYRTVFLADSIPLLSNFQDNFIRESFVGGRVEVFIPGGKNLFFYDVISLYPFVMLNQLPLKAVSWDNNITYQTVDNFCGFAEVEIKKTPSMFIPVLPYKNENMLKFPIGTWKATYFSEELKYAKSLGYEFTILKALSFKTDNAFTNYVNYFFNVKKNTKLPILYRTLAKLFLNVLYGRFGVNPQYKKAEIINLADLPRVKKNYDVPFIKDLNANKVLVIKEPKLKTRCTTIQDFYRQITYKNVAISASISSLGRIYLHKILTLNSTDFYYCDTDCVITNKLLPENFVSTENLGKFKLRRPLIQNAVFAKPKHYSLVYLTKNKLKKKEIKPLPHKKNQNINFPKLKNNLLKRNTFFKKRELVYNLEQIWINTSPPSV